LLSEIPQVFFKDADRPRVLLAATKWWPLSARLAMAFLRHGCRVSAVCPTGHPLRFVKGIESLYPERGDTLGRVIAAIRPDLIVPSDDSVVWQMHRLHASTPKLRPFIENSLGAPEWYATIRSRGETLQVASEMGIRIPETRTVASEKDLYRWYERPGAVLKLDGTWGGTGVEIARSPEEMCAAFSRLSKSWKTNSVLKRLLLNRDPSVLWRRSEERRITIQEFIPGRPANTMFSCFQGKVISSVTVEVVCAYGTTGIATVVRLIQNGEIAEASRLIARRLMLNGFYGLDFILEQRSGNPYLIEMNPRCTQLGHLCLPGQGDLAGALIARLKGGCPSLENRVITSDTIAFFPQAFHLNPKNPYLWRGYHDVPWEEPELLHELLRDSWPHRQWHARLYYLLRPARKYTEMQFDQVAAGHSDQELIPESAFNAASKPET
jgi:hypothetical protein